MTNNMISEHDSAILNKIFNPNQPFEPSTARVNTAADDQREIETETTREVKRLELAGVKAAESGDFKNSLEFFTRAINLEPERGSAYNNRAQALRLKGDVEGALQDLNKSIELTSGKGQVACLAFTQRGLIRKLKEDVEGATNDFQKAANLGCPFAKQQVVEMNPYSAMCNKMLNEVMVKLREGNPVE
ncbi:tetratricopeptide repeat protein 36-like [Tubulanus polymorphus]|uniref:tetratricopeptide repeat protein 36-like n=1 Tax=Tubulanus polymorphus TaxID=672921 RepID=UPI003DA680F7